MINKMEAEDSAGRPLDNRRAATGHFRRAEAGISSSNGTVKPKGRRPRMIFAPMPGIDAGPWRFRRYALRTLEAAICRALPMRGFGLIVPMLLAGNLLASEFYLARLGPAPLRFASTAVKPKGLARPEAASPSDTNATAALNIAAPTSGTNSAPSGPNAADLQRTPKTSYSEPVTALAASNPASGPAEPTGFDGNPLSASNLLVVTPQMLADYFKAGIDAAVKPGTNSVPTPDVLFAPPTPKPITPSSEATYRIQ